MIPKGETRICVVTGENSHFVHCHAMWGRAFYDDDVENGPLANLIDPKKLEQISQK